MQEIGAFEAKNSFGSLLDRVQKGEEIIITRHGKAVARLISNDGGIDHEQVEAAFTRIRARAAQFAGVEFDWEALKADRDAGRP